MTHIDIDKICSVTEFRDNIKSYLDEINETDVPQVLLSNGKPRAVVISPEEFKRLSRDAKIVEERRAIAVSLAQANEGKTRPMRESIHELADKYSISLED